MRWMKVLTITVACLGLSVAIAQAQEDGTKEPCPRNPRQKLAPEELQRKLSDHMRWLNEATSSAVPNSASSLRANLCNADLRGAELNNTNLFGAKLNNADLGGAKLNKANLRWAELNEANLGGTELNNANLGGAELKEAHLAYAQLKEATYAPTSAPPNSHVVGITGLDTVTFPKGAESGLVQLRDLLKKAGLRDLERQATYAIESGKTQHALNTWNDDPINAAEGVFRLITFDLTTAYGLHPSRALTLIGFVWLLLIPAYWDSVWEAKASSGIFQVWSKDRIETWGGTPTVNASIYVQRLHAPGLKGLPWAAYFSLLSAFHIGFREFSVGTWLSRVQSRSYTLQSEGWVRTVSGIQSLLSVFLFAMWALTYFGRPFQ